MDLQKILKRAQNFGIEHGPEILIGLGITGFFTTTILAVRATPKALILIEEEKERQKAEELTVVETVKATWTCYIPAAISGALSVGCIIGSNYIQGRRTAALSAAYHMSEAALKTYQEKVIETIGENKEKKIRDEIAKDKINEHAPATREIIFTSNGSTLCYDSFRDRYFDGDIEKIRRLESNLNHELQQSMFVSLNEYYYGLGLRPVPDGDDIGWDVDKGPIRFDYSSQLAPDDRPVFVISLTNVGPRFDYRSA